MAGYERLEFSVDGIFVNGFRANTDTDYVSSAVSDSGATIHCFLPQAKIASSENGLRDTYGALAGSKLTELYNGNQAKYTYHG